MAVPISNVVRRIVFAPSGVGPYAFTFEILAATDIEVYKGDTLLTLTTDYTVTINPNGTGEVTLVATAGTDNITIVGARTIQRTTDFVTGGDLFANSLNEELDSLTIFVQQNAEAGDRAIRAPVTDPTNIDMTLPTRTDRAGKYLSFNSSTGDPEVVNNVVDITAVAANATNINTVAGQITPVNNISTVAGAAANISTVAGIAANVTTVAGISGNVTTVAGISADVTAVAGDATDIGTVAGLSTEIGALGPIAADITTVAGIDSDVTAVAADATDIGTVAGNIANVNTVAGISADVTTVAADGTDIGTVAGISGDVTTVAGIAANVTTVAGISANVTTVAGISADVTTVATNVADITNFSDVYLGPAATDPATRNDSSALQAGDLYFNTVDDAIKVYTGSAWVTAYITADGFVTVADAQTITGVKTFDNGLNTDTISEETSAAGVTVDGVILKDSQVSTDQINEKTSAAGVTIDGVLLKDSEVTTDVIKEKTSATGVTVDSVLLKDGMVVTDSSMNFRNRIINGDMRIAQRGTSANPTTFGYFTVDRWLQGGTVLGTIQPVVSQSTDAPPGFTNSYSYVNTNALTLTGTQNVNISQPIEGFNIADLGFGTASAKTVTVSFWVKSSLTGKFPVRLNNSASNRFYMTTYTINAAGTWEYKTITIPGDTAGTWLTNNGIGIDLRFFLGSGPDRFGTPDVWGDTNVQGPSDIVQLTETAGATWQLTGVQLEVGSVATPFERRPFGTELMLCQRYYEVLYYASNTLASMGQAITTSRAISPITWTVIKRATPTLFAATGTFGSWNANAGSANSGTNTLDAQTVSNCRFDMASIASAPLVAGNASGLYASTACTITISSEL